MKFPFDRDRTIVNSHLAKRRFDFYGDDTLSRSFIVHSGAIQSATTNTVTLASDASSTNDTYNGYGFVVGNEDRSRISDYDGTTKVATLSVNFDTVPSAGAIGKVINRGYT